jgi:hypothetical protein
VGELLSLLRDPKAGAATARLAQVVVEDLLARSLEEVVNAHRSATVAIEVLGDWLRSERAEIKLLEAWNDGIERVRCEDRKLGELAPAEVVEAVEKLAMQHYSPDRELLLSVLDRPPVRELFRDLLTETLTSFGKKISAGGGSSALGALGKLGAGRSKGGLLGRVGGVASAVGGEVERQLERRIPEYVDSGLSQMIQRFVELLSDPARAAEQAEVRVALLQGLWERTGPEVASELARLDAAATAAVLRQSLSAWVGRPEAVPQLAAWIEGITAEYGGLHLARVLEDLDLLELFEQYAIELAHGAALSLFETQAFALWLESLSEG